MPLNTLRLNHAPSSHPNDRITFIKPLPGPASATADTFLRAIAAQCLPIMKSHYLSVTTLEEHEWNREFVGRNFNNGEVIQLVLRGRGGGWLPFRMVQMVMMHELAHNTHMNHGKGFWKVRNGYAAEMQTLWTRGYSGEGFWGSGRTLEDLGTVMGNNVLSSEELAGLPLCGGTFRSRRRKRKAGAGSGASELSWKEKRDRRIEKKFGKNGVSLGEDEEKRLALELSRKGPIGGKPRVAQSKRGRELRAAAALARFETNKQEVKALEKPKKEEDHDDDDDGEEEDEYEDVDANQEDARDHDGSRLLDAQGRGMVRVCDDEDVDDVNVKREIEELEGLEKYFLKLPRSDQAQSDRQANEADSATQARKNVPSSGLNGQKEESKEIVRAQCKQEEPDETNQPENLSAKDTKPAPPVPNSPGHVNIPTGRRPVAETTIDCQICSLANPSGGTATCAACSNVIRPDLDPRHWRCLSQVCRENASGYLNGGDAGVCGVCGTRKGDGCLTGPPV